MKRVLKALVLGAAISLLCVSPSSAAPPTVNNTQVRAATGDAFWNIDPDNTDGTTRFVGVAVVQGRSTGNNPVANLVAEDTTQHWQDGHPAGFTSTRVNNATSGFTFSQRQPLASGKLTGSALPATTCDYDANAAEVPGSCTTTTVTLNIDWVGFGQTFRDVSTFHSGPPDNPEIVFNEHDIVFVREATATGTFNSEVLGASTQALLGSINIGQHCAGCES